VIGMDVPKEDLNILKEIMRYLTENYYKIVK